MNKHKDDKWLDELLYDTINIQRPEFDDQKWKQKFPDEFNALQSRAKVPAHPVRRMSFLRSPVIKFSAAAVVIMAIGLFMIFDKPGEKVDIPYVVEYTKSPAEMESLLSFNIAYRRGGIDAVEKQSDIATQMLGPRPAEVTIKQILTEFNGT
jgi:hypothetical protein